MTATLTRDDKTIDATIPVGIGQVQLVRNRWSEPIDKCATAAGHHLELALLPRSNLARGCFPEAWGPDHFEPIGAMFLLPAGHVIHARSDCREQSSIVCNLDPAAVSHWFGEVEWTHQRLQASLDIASDVIRSLLLRIRAEIRTPGFGTDALVELIAAQIAIELSRYLTGTAEEARSGGLAAWRLALIDERLADDAGPPSLTELASLCNLSVRHLTRAFRASRGRSIGSLIAQLRVDRARRLLESGMCIKSVAHATGFSAASNFAAAFVRATGETPREYRTRVSRCASGSRGSNARPSRRRFVRPS